MCANLVIFYCKTITASGHSTMIQKPHWLSLGFNLLCYEIQKDIAYARRDTFSKRFILFIYISIFKVFLQYAVAFSFFLFIFDTVVM